MRCFAGYHFPVDYSNKLDAVTSLSLSASRTSDLRLGRKLTVYFFNCYAA
jgi:hypothetical protein